MALGRTTLTLQKLVPARFLTMTAHLVLAICVFWSKDTSVYASLPSDYTSSEYKMRDVEFTVALSLTMICFLVEYMGFLSGVSMFNTAFSLLCSQTFTPVTVCESVRFLQISAHLSYNPARCRYNYAERFYPEILVALLVLVYLWLLLCFPCCFRTCLDNPNDEVASILSGADSKLTEQRRDEMTAVWIRLAS